MKNLKIYLFIFLTLDVLFIISNINKYIHIGASFVLFCFYFILIFRFEKKFKNFLGKFRQASSKVNRASLTLTDASKKLTTSNQALNEAFQSSVSAIQEITNISEQNLKLVDENQIQNENSKSVAQEGQKTLNLAIDEIRQLASYSEKIKEVTSLIDEIAFKTNILSLNAAVEAARAGEHGKGFSVVAEAVRDLANQSSEATKTINKVIDMVVEKAGGGASYADQSGEKILQILNNIEKSVEISKHVHIDTESQTQQISQAHESLQKIEEKSQENTSLSQKTMNIAVDLSAQASTFEEIIGQLSEEFQTDIESDSIKKSLAFARHLANKTTSILESLITSKNLNESIFFEFEYEELKGSKIHQLSGLFNAAKVPSTGFLPPKYSTRYDSLIDQALQPIFEEVFNLGPNYLFALPVDLNAYAPIHNKKYCKDWVGQYNQDLVGNRVKRFFSENMTFLKSTRVGLGPGAAKLPIRIQSREILINSGCWLKKNRQTQNSFLVQTYLRDTGELATNLSVPIFIHGERFGTVVICWLEEES